MMAVDQSTIFSGLEIKFTVSINKQLVEVMAEMKVTTRLDPA
jgi:hypothetical protein